MFCTTLQESILLIVVEKQPYTWEQSQLNQWEVETQGKVSNMISFTGYDKLGGSLGLCTRYTNNSFKIQLSERIENSYIASKSVLWHEYCHAWDYMVNGHMGHSMSFLKLWFSKPIYVLQMFYDAIMFIIGR